MCVCVCVCVCVRVCVCVCVLIVCGLDSQICRRDKNQVATLSTFQSKLLKCRVSSWLEQFPDNAVRLLQVSLYHGDLPTVPAEDAGQRRAQHSRSHDHDLALTVKGGRSRLHVLALREGEEKTELSVCYRCRDVRAPQGCVGGA